MVIGGLCYECFFLCNLWCVYG